MAAPLWDTRMSDAEGLMWRAEKDPFLSSTFGSITLLDRPPDMSRLRRRLERAAVVIPRLHQRVQPSPVSLTPPSWVDDPNFDFDFHVRHVALPGEGRVRQLLDLAAQLVADPFDRTRPLWEFVMVDGVEGGRAALVQKMHHTITDGEGGIRLSMQFLDTEPDAPEPPPPGPEELPPAATGSEPDPIRTIVTGGLRVPLGFARQMTSLLVDPTTIPAAGAAALASVRGVIGQLSDVQRARSPLWTERSLRRRIEVLGAPFDATKLAAKALGGTLNTAFITVAAAAAGEYHRRLGQPVESLRTSMAISTRTKHSGSNAFSLARLEVPTGEMPIAERFARVQEQADRARTAGGSNMQVLAAIATTLPTSVITRIARQQAESIDFATSNVRAAPFPLYIAGARIEHTYPVGPLAGVAFNLTLMSYCGSLDIGLHLDPAAVAEPELLRVLMEDAFAELADSA
jgi:WS/DGAT/MGAT family acyltransferase